jgi:hypothetical protein
MGRRVVTGLAVHCAFEGPVRAELSEHNTSQVILVA